MLWEVEIRPGEGEVDREGQRVLAECRELGLDSIREVSSARSFLLQGELNEDEVSAISRTLLVDSVSESSRAHRLDGSPGTNGSGDQATLLTVLFKPGVTDNVGQSAQKALRDQKVSVDAVATCRRYRLNVDARPADIDRLSARVLAGRLAMDRISIGSE